MSTTTSTSKAAREQMYEETERAILAIIQGGMNKEDLFWARIDIGMDYLRNLHGDWKASTIWKKKSFWAWFRQTWHVNDKKILAELMDYGVKRIGWNEYIDSQHALMTKWKINETVL